MYKMSCVGRNRMKSWVSVFQPLAILAMALAAGAWLPAAAQNDSKQPVQQPQPNTTTYTISGRITSGSTGLYGITVELTGDMDRSTTTNSTGNYSFSVQSSVGSYYFVAPSSSAYTFTPDGIEIDNINSNKTANFAATPITPTETISTPSTPSGPTSGVTGTSYIYSTGGASSNLGHSVQYQFNWGDGSSSWGGTSATHTWNTPGAYTVTAQARCATDTSKTSSTSGGMTVTITATPVTAQITNTTRGGSTIFYPGDSYRVTVTGTPSQPVTYSGTCGDLSTWPFGAAPAPGATDTSGNYVLNGTLTPPMQGLIGTWTESWAVSGRSASFTLTVYGAVSGQVTSGGVGLQGVTMTLTPGNITATTDLSGNYTFSGLGSNTYSVTPTKTPYAFSPGSQSTPVTAGNATGINFVTVPTISGQATLSGTGQSGVTMTLGGASSDTKTTDGSGNYSFTVTNGSYTVAATKTGYGYDSSPRPVTVNNANVTAVNFTGSAATYIISGRLTYKGGYKYS